MKPSKLLEEAKAFSGKPRLEQYRGAISELKRKGLSYREIADFLNERGLETDHTAVYRLVVEGNPLLSDTDERMLIGELEYEMRKGRPLHPYRNGLFVQIKSSRDIFILENEERVSSIWVEAQFELNTAPNYCWIQRLCQALDIVWNPDEPCFLQGRFGFQLKFEGTLMAMVCKQFNLESEVNQLTKAVRKTTEFFLNEKDWLALRQKQLAERKTKVLQNMVLAAHDDPDEVYEEHLKRVERDHKDLRKEFHSIALR